MPSPTRTYVAMCNRQDFLGFYFRQFYLPEEFSNTTSMAQWFFTNRLNKTACVNTVMSVEDWSDLTEEEQGDNGVPQ